MNRCAEIKDNLPLYLYGELNPGEEEVLEAHLTACAECRGHRDMLEQLFAALNDEEAQPSLELLSSCRTGLRDDIAFHESARKDVLGWRRFVPGFATLRAYSWKPAAAFSLLALGFIAGRGNWVPAVSTGDRNPVASRIRYVERGPSGDVEIGVDEVRQRVLSGRVDDRTIRELLLIAAADPSDPGLRVDTLEVLKNRCERDEVRTALIRALEKDPNDGVRLKALEALRPYAAQPDVRASLGRVLRSNAGPNVRIQVIDLLAATQKHSELAGTLQELLEREQNKDVRQRSQTVLRAMNASLESF